MPHAEAQLARSRIFVTRANVDGSATTRILVNCTLADLARATGLRPEDAAFALNEAGLVSRRIVGSQWNAALVVTREDVETVARDREVKEMVMQHPCVLLA